MFSTLIKHEFLTNQRAQDDIYILNCDEGPLYYAKILECFSFVFFVFFCILLLFVFHLALNFLKYFSIMMISFTDPC